MNEQNTNQAFPVMSESPVQLDVNTYTKFINAFGPWEYTGWTDESMSWKETCYIGDWSPLPTFHVKGPDALKFFSVLGVNSLAKFDIGQAKHFIMCNEDGKVISESILMRFAEDELLLISCIPWPIYVWQSGKYGKFDIMITDMGGKRFVFQVQGPNSLYLLEKLTGESLRDIGFMRFRKTRIKDYEVVILRQGMAGEIGFELQGPAEYGIEVYSAVLEAGREFGIRRLGERTKMVNHVEACFPTIVTDYLPAVFGEREKGYFDTFMNADTLAYMKMGGSNDSRNPADYCRSPIELGWGKNIRFDHEFIGREALEKEAKNPRRNMVTLVWNPEDVLDTFASFFKKDDTYQFMEFPRNLLGCVHADKVLKDGRLVGFTTSRCYSYYFREMISLCTLDVDLCRSGTEVTVIWGEPGTRQKEIRATVAQAPYKKDNRRIDLAGLPDQL